MDLRSEARALRRPFLIETGFREGARRPIGDRLLIGDGHSAALVRVDGAIDWLAMPRFDADPVFAQILDEEHGGFCAVAPVQRPFESLQRYDPDTAVVETLMMVPGQGSLRLTDHMPWTDDPRASIHEVHRRIECVEGEVEVEVVVDPRFGFSKTPPEIRRRPHGLLALGAQGEKLAVSLGDQPFEARAPSGVRARFRLARGERRFLTLSWGAEDAEVESAYRPYEMLRSTRHAWRDWSSRLRYDGPWRHLVLRSAITLKLLQYAPTGGLVAAPTTSLPEWIGGERNWDYRFVWARDAGLAIRATNLIGYDAEARSFFHFVRDTLGRDARFPIMTTIDGQPVPDERVVADLSGYRGSGPVRSGNGANDQVQIDSAGYVMDAAWVYEHIGGSLTLGVWRHLSRLADVISRMWKAPDHGIWEPRADPRHHVHSKVMSWVCMDRAARIAPLFGAAESRQRWAKGAHQIRDQVLERGCSSGGDHLVSYYGADDVDASLLLMPGLRFLPHEHPLVTGTVDEIQRRLSDRGFIRRYQWDDGVAGEEGAFIICGFWLAEALAMVGRVDEAQEVFAQHASVANHAGLLSEEVDPTTREPLGNFPQAFSHLGLISAACRIDLALRLRDEGAAQTPLFILER